MDEGIEGRGDQVRVVMLKSQASFNADVEDEEDERPEQMMRLPYGSCGAEGLDTREEGSLAMICSP